MGRRIKIIQHLEQVFEPYRMMFKELKGKKEAAFITVLNIPGFLLSAVILNPHKKARDEFMINLAKA
jgi:hypothetical protein